MSDVVPLVDLAWQHSRIAEEVRAGIDGLFDRSAYVLGEEVQTFEEGFAASQGVDHCIGVANGTDALEIALRALDVPAGAEVIMPANTFVATAFAALRAGTTPVFVDVDPSTLLVQADAIDAAITPSTGAVIPVHLFGRVAPMKDIVAVGTRAGVPIVEDAAQAQGARQDGKSAGSFGALGATSFYPGKNLGAYGDAGAVITGSADLAARCRRMRSHGGEAKYEHLDFGFNSRLDTIQAIVLSAKLARLQEWNDLRRAAADRYDGLLADVEGVERPAVAAPEEHVWHLYVVRVDDRDRVLDRLNANGIGAGVHYPSPVHLLPAFTRMGYRPGSCPVAEDAATRILSLPLFPGITEAQQLRVVEALTKALP